MPFPIPSALLAIVWAVGCATTPLGTAPEGRTPRYSVGFSNATEQKLTHVRIEWHGPKSVLTAEAGNVVPGGVQSGR